MTIVLVESILAADISNVDEEHEHSVQRLHSRSVKFIGVASEKLRNLDLRKLTDELQENWRNLHFYDAHDNLESILTLATDLENEEAAKHLELHISGADEPVFSLTKSEASTVTQLCREMSDIVLQSQDFLADHKTRILKRIQHVEIEVLKTNGRLDVILGAVVDIGDAAGKFGEKIEPLVKRISEIRKITQSKSEAYEKLPPPEEIKQLPPPEDDN